MKQKVVHVQNLVQHVLKMSVFFQFHETNLVDVLHCGDVLPKNCKSQNTLDLR